MRHVLLLIFVCIALLLTNYAQAGVYNFTPSDNDLGDLAHDYYYAWGIDWYLPEGEEIVEAYLSIDNINDWTQEANDRLYMHILDNPKKGINKWFDNEGGKDNWADKDKNALGITGPLIATYTDKNSYSEDLEYQFSLLGLIPDLNAAVKSKPGYNKANFGIGFDPDCHYYNCGIKLTIHTEPVPEPSGLLVIFSCISSAAGVVKLRKKS